MRHKILAIIGSRVNSTEESIRCRDLVKSIFSCIDKRDYIIISGGCTTGADYWAREACKKLRYRYIESPPFWDTYGIYAGPFRNETISMVADMAVAVWDGKSTGTGKTIELFVKRNKPVWILKL